MMFVSLKFVVALAVLFAFSNTAAQEDEQWESCTSDADCSDPTPVCIFPPGIGHGDGDNDSSEECDSSCALAEACYNSQGCMFRDTEDGSWTGAMAACNPANGYCDKCFPDTPCPTKKGGKGSKGSNGANVTPNKVDETDVVISEVSSNPVKGTCGGQDYIELFNPVGFTVYLDGYVLHDDRGPKDPKAFEFPALSKIESKGVLLLCANGNGKNSPSFGIKDNDAISLYDTTHKKPITSAGRMRGERGEGESWTLQSDGTYAYSKATPRVFRNYGSSPENNYEEEEDVMDGSATTSKFCRVAFGLSLTLVILMISFF